VSGDARSWELRSSQALLFQGLLTKSSDTGLGLVELRRGTVSVVLDLVVGMLAHTGPVGSRTGERLCQLMADTRMIGIGGGIHTATLVQIIVGTLL